MEWWNKYVYAKKLCRMLKRNTATEKCYVCMLEGDCLRESLTKRLPQIFILFKEDFPSHAPALWFQERGVFSLTNCDKSHPCNQWFRVSRAAPVRKCEIIYPSFCLWIYLFVSRDFPLAECPITQMANSLPTQGNWVLSVMLQLVKEATWKLQCQ